MDDGLGWLNLVHDYATLAHCPRPEGVRLGFFPFNDLIPGEITELHGFSGSCKSLLALQAVASCVLPLALNGAGGAPPPGNAAAVIHVLPTVAICVSVSLDDSLSLDCLVAVLEGRIADQHAHTYPVRPPTNGISLVRDARRMLRH